MHGGYKSVGVEIFFRGKVENKRKLGSGVGVHVHWVRVRVRAKD